MARGYRRKCKCCHQLFTPDPRNRRHQHYCSAPACRAASKAASQARWRQKPENQHYFRGPVHVARVQAWRQAHPGYAKSRPKDLSALQDLSMLQAVESNEKNGKIATSALQDVLMAQPAVLIGLIAHIAASPLQEDIAQVTRRLLQLGQDILARPGATARPSDRSSP